MLCNKVHSESFWTVLTMDNDLETTFENNYNAWKLEHNAEELATGNSE